MITLKLSVTNCYLIDLGSGYLQVDTGYEKDKALYMDLLNKNGISLKDISVILVTHAHDDHAGLITYMVEENPAIRVVAHKDAIDTLARGKNDISVKGYNPNLIVNTLLKITYALDKTWTLSFPPYCMRGTDIIVGEGKPLDRTILEDLGLKDGVIYSTPGHCRGHISLRIGYDTVITGDSVSDMLPWAGTRHVPLYFEDISRLYSDWDVLMNSSGNAPIFYPGHGGPVSKDALSKDMLALQSRNYYEQKLKPR